MPLMFILEMILIKRIWSQKMRLRQTVNEIWLHKNGEEIEVAYMNRFFVACGLLRGNSGKSRSRGTSSHPLSSSSTT